MIGVGISAISHNSQKFAERFARGSTSVEPSRGASAKEADWVCFCSASLIT